MSASRIGTFGEAGEADPGRTLRAGALDLAAALLVAMLLWPFPLIRLTLGWPWAVHVPLIVVWVFLVYASYLAASVALWGRTPSMYLLDLGLAGRARPFPWPAATRWAAGWALAVVPGLVGARTLVHPRDGLPARLSGLVTVTAAAEER